MCFPPGADRRHRYSLPRKKLQTGQNSSKSWPAVAPNLPLSSGHPNFPFKNSACLIWPRMIIIKYKTSHLSCTDRETTGNGWILKEKLVNIVELFRDWLGAGALNAVLIRVPLHTYFLYRYVILVFGGGGWEGSILRVAYRESWMKWEQMGSPQTSSPEASG